MSQNLLILTGQMKQNLKVFRKLAGSELKPSLLLVITKGGGLTEDDFKAIPKLGAEVWQPLLDQKAINFGSPAPSPYSQM